MNVKKLDIQDLSNWFRSGIKPESEWGIGTEHEQFIYDKKDLKRLAYGTQLGIKKVLQELQKDIWEQIGRASCRERV